MKETAVESHIKLDAAQLGIDLWRNNSGGFYDHTGRFVRYGLGSFTKEQKIKSADYIGITQVVITPDMVGQIIGVFTAVETKKPGWIFNSSDEHSLHQWKFLDIVARAGGYAGFAQSVQDFRRIVRK